jgi:excisionase family DNA binding protein
MSNENTVLGSLLTYREAAAFLRISPLTLRKKVSKRQVPCLKPFGRNGKTLFDPEALHAFVQDSAVEMIPSAPAKKRR